MRNYALESGEASPSAPSSFSALTSVTARRCGASRRKISSSSTSSADNGLLRWTRNADLHRHDCTAPGPHGRDPERTASDSERFMTASGTHRNCIFRAHKFRISLLVKVSVPFRWRHLFDEALQGGPVFPAQFAIDNEQPLLVGG